jgi:hypothetical protein
MFFVERKMFASNRGWYEQEQRDLFRAQIKFAHLV